jgi:hypothetical protein
LGGTAGGVGAGVASLSAPLMADLQNKAAQLLMDMGLSGETADGIAGFTTGLITAGIAGGVSGSSIGAAVGGNVDFNNRQADHDVKDLAKKLARKLAAEKGIPEENMQRRMDAVLCYLLKCSQNYSVGSPDYKKAEALELSGAQYQDEIFFLTVAAHQAGLGNRLGRNPNGDLRDEKRDRLISEKTQYFRDSTTGQIVGDTGANINRGAGIAGAAAAAVGAEHIATGFGILGLIGTGIETGAKRNPAMGLGKTATIDQAGNILSKKIPILAPVINEVTNSAGGSETFTNITDSVDKPFQDGITDWQRQKEEAEDAQRTQDYIRDIFKSKPPIDKTYQELLKIQNGR